MDDVVTLEDIEAQAVAARPAAPIRRKLAPVKGATWEYAAAEDSIEVGLPDDSIWERLRLRRNALLAESDWRVVGDAPWDTAPWIDYRQALRDLPQVSPDPRKAAWPTQP